jgi:TRAP-type uncharacterized transport system substrate-binding protein
MKTTYLRIVLTVLAIAAIAFLVRDIYQSLPSERVRILTGPVGGSFYKTALDYKQLLEHRGYKVEIEPVANTAELAQLVNASTTRNTISFMIGSIDRSHLSQVRALSVIGTQPLFLFYQNSLGQLVSLSSLKGSTIVLPPKTSLSAHYALSVLDLYGINSDNTSIDFIPFAEMIQKLKRAEYFAGFVMLSADSPAVEDLARDDKLSLYSYHHIRGILAKIKDLDAVVLPLGGFDVLQNIPHQPTDLLAGRVEVIANKSIDKSILYALLESFENLHYPQTLVSKPGEFPIFAGANGVMHESVQNFQKTGTPWLYRNFPPTLAVLIDKYLFIGLAIFLLAEIYKNLRYLYELIVLTAETFALRIMTRTNSRLQSGKSLGFFAQFAKRWAITTIERQSIRQKAAALIAPKEKK